MKIRVFLFNDTSSKSPERLILPYIVDVPDNWPSMEYDDQQDLLDLKLGEDNWHHWELI